MVEFCFVLSAIAAAFSITAMIFAARNATLLRALREAFADLPMSRLRSIAQSQESLQTRQEETDEAVKLLANKLKMMRVRGSLSASETSSKAEPDPHADPERWRAWMNAKLARNRHGL